MINLGTKRAWLVHGLDGTDEISIVAPTKVVEIRDGQMQKMTVTPSDFGLEAAPLTAILGGEPEYNAERFKALFGGQRDAYRDAVVMNAAAALLIADVLMICGRALQWRTQRLMMVRRARKWNFW